MITQTEKAKAFKALHERDGRIYYSQSLGFGFGAAACEFGI